MLIRISLTISGSVASVMIVDVIIGIVTFLAIACLFLIDNAFDRIFGWLFRKAGLQSGNGPLRVGSRV